MLWKLVLVVVAGLLVFAWSRQRILLYFPDPARIAPASVGLAEVIEVTLKAPDGVELIAWYGMASPGQPTLLYFHGNAGNPASRAGRVDEFMARGYGMVVLAYRGYGGSGGKPTEANNVADAKLAYDWLKRQGLEGRDIILYGESLGSGVAVQLAASRPVGGVILDAPYTSIADVGARLYPWLPVRALLLDRYDSLAQVGRIEAPLLIVHGEHDGLIPIAFGRKLYGAAAEPKQFAEIAGAGHSDHHLFGSYEVMFAWLAKTRQRAKNMVDGARSRP